MDKTDLRRWAKGLVPVTPSENHAVLAHLADWLCQLKPGTTVLTFLAMAGEIDLAPLAASFSSLEWVVTRTPAEGDLTVHPLSSPRERHRLGFEQPRAHSAEIEPQLVDVALVPGLAFDVCGGRLGRGKAYYDRLLRNSVRAVRVGVTLQRRVVERLPTDHHDVGMHRIVTEVGCWEVVPCDS